MRRSSDPDVATLKKALGPPEPAPEVPPEAPADAPTLAPRPPRPRRSRQPASFGSSAWYYFGFAWQVVLLLLFFALCALIIWIIGAVLPHLPSIAQSTVGHGIITVSRWEGHWFAKIPAPKPPKEGLH